MFSAGQVVRNCASAQLSSTQQPILPIYVCYACLRAGKGAMTKDTEFGMVSWEQASQGITHGIPGLKTNDFELVLIDPDEEWYGVRMPEEHLFELLRTPAFHTWQGERWLFCCKQPMTYAGGWDHVSEAQFVPDDQKEFVEGIVHPDERDWVWRGEARRRAAHG